MFKKKSYDSKENSEDSSNIEQNKNGIKDRIMKRKKQIIISTVAGVLVIGTTFGFINYKANAETLYHVYVDGNEIGTVDSTNVIDQWKDIELKIAKENYDLSNINIKNDITYKKEIKYKGSFDNIKTLQALENKIQYVTNGVEITVDGKVVGVVKDQATADKIIDQLKEAYIPKSEKNKIVAASIDSSAKQKDIKIKSVELKENVEAKYESISLDKILDENTMLNLLQKGTLEEKKYTVQSGDTISGIASQFGLTTKQVYQLNPQLTGELIHIGDVLNVTAMTPLVTVETVEEVTQKESIPYHVVYRESSSMYVNERKIEQYGKEGQKEVTYSEVKENGILTDKEILSETVLNKPVTKIIVSGTKIIPARGSGELIWPTVGGIITSYFGPRWGKFHEGIDISGVRDYTIKAADNGKVIYAGWRGGYGNAVMIDHGNGIVTLYGHMRKLTVSVGDKVAKGQQIGIMGSTGDSTGTHLHFEVRVNGKFKNPLNYVGK